MKILFVNGDDFCALTFEQHFKNKKVSEIINNLDAYKREFFEKNPEYEEDADIYVEELNMDENAYSTIKTFFMDYDSSKDSDTYSENSIIGNND
jgi:hypothetical protein